MTRDAEKHQKSSYTSTWSIGTVATVRWNDGWAFLAKSAAEHQR
jgi:hypothetical protein